METKQLIANICNCTLVAKARNRTEAEDPHHAWATRCRTMGSEAKPRSRLTLCSVFSRVRRGACFRLKRGCSGQTPAVHSDAEQRESAAGGPTMRENACTILNPTSLRRRSARQGRRGGTRAGPCPAPRCRGDLPGPVPGDCCALRSSLWHASQRRARRRRSPACGTRQLGRSLRLRCQTSALRRCSSMVRMPVHARPLCAAGAVRVGAAQRPVCCGSKQEAWRPGGGTHTA